MPRAIEMAATLAAFSARAQFASPPAPPSAQRTRRAWAWADLMRRVFAIDVLACAGCGGRLRFIATIEDPPIVAKILEHLGLPTAGPALAPARPPSEPAGFDFA